MKTKLFDVQNLLWLALALALAGSLKHLAAIFASIDGNLILGYGQAIAIDAGLFALAYSIKGRKVAKRSIKPLWGGVAMFTVISIYGNLAYGLFATSGNLPGWIVATKPYILAASLPVLVLFLSELLSDDRQHAAKVAEAEAKKMTKRGTDSLSVQENVTTLDQARQAKMDKLTARRQAVSSLLHEGLPEDVIAGQLGVSLRTIKRDVDVINTNGNGNGVAR